MNLKYKTRGNSEPKGKPRVYFSCHPVDFDTAFPLISEDILGYANCSIWYDEDLTGPVDEQELTEILRDMQLVVFGITSKFLHEAHRAKDLELPIAIRENIPILPIMLENGLGYEFSNTCAKIQVVSRYVTDSTATPYEEVLKTYLHSVLVGDELAEKVRSAFDAYVFMSYRKKDRRHAQRLMRLIHEDKNFRDIAIWYDEYLVPGERFNDAIKEAFEKSSLFAMAVTPHLEEDKNYVMRVEYPLARDRRKTEKNYEVIPVEMYEPGDSVDGKDWRIDQARLQGHDEFKYQEISNLKDEHRRPELDQTFLTALGRIAKKKSEGTSLHRFLIGIAYLNGIDVEKDPDEALKLIVSAATDPHPCMYATEMLVDMYRNGDGVKPDIKEAIRWQKLLVSQYREAYETDHDPDAHKGYGTSYFKALVKLSDLMSEDGHRTEAVRLAVKALEFSEKLVEEVGIREQSRDRALILNRLGSLNRELGHYSEAREYFARAVQIYEKLAGEIGTQRARRDLSIGQERLGDIDRKTGDLSDADKCYKKAKAIREELNAVSPSPTSRRDLSAILTKLGNVRKSEKKYEEARYYYENALEMDEILTQETKTTQAWDDYAVSLVKIGDIHKAQKEYPDAVRCYEKACRIFETNVEKTGSLIYLDHYAGGCEKLASARKKTGNAQEAGRLYREAVAMREKLYEASKTVSNAHALAVSCFNAAAFFDDRQLMDRAYKIWDALCEKYPEYAKYRDKARKAMR